MDQRARDLKKAQALLIACAFLGIITLSTCVAYTISVTKWANKKKSVIAIPSEIEAPLPFVYQQTALNSTNEDARVKSFIFEYIHLTQDMLKVNYHAKTSAGRYNAYRPSENLERALVMSVGPELVVNRTKLRSSSEDYEFLDRYNSGLIFNIDSILVNGFPGISGYIVTVQGFFQVMKDQAINPNFPHFFYGYKQITLVVLRNPPELVYSTSKEQNKYGLYVHSSQINTLTIEQADKLQKRNNTFYLTRQPAE